MIGSAGCVLSIRARIGALIALTGALAFAPASAPPLHAQDETFRFSGDRTRVVLAEGSERTVLQGNARIVSNSIAITADEIELSGEDFRTARTRGGVRIEDGERGLVIRAGTVEFDRITENSLARGDVIVEDATNELVLRGEYLETTGGGDLLVMQIGVRVLREDLTARSQYLRYRRVDDTLELSGFPVVFWNGDEYRASRIVLDLETEEIEMSGQVEGAIVVDPPATDEGVDGAGDDAAADAGDNSTAGDRSAEGARQP